MQAFNLSPIQAAPPTVEGQATSPQKGEETAFAPLLTTSIESQNQTEQSTDQTLSGNVGGEQASTSQESEENQEMTPLSSDDLQADTMLLQAQATSLLNTNNLSQNSSLNQQFLLKQTDANLQGKGVNNNMKDVSALLQAFKTMISRDQTGQKAQTIPNGGGDNLATNTLTTARTNASQLPIQENLNQTANSAVTGEFQPLQKGNPFTPNSVTSAQNPSLSQEAAVSLNRADQLLSEMPTASKDVITNQVVTLTRNEAKQILDSGQLDPAIRQQLERFLSADERNSIVVRQQPQATMDIMASRIPVQVATAQTIPHSQTTATLPESLLAATLAERPASVNGNTVKTEDPLPSLRQNQHGFPFDAKAVAAAQKSSNESQQHNFMAQGEGGQQEAALTSSSKPTPALTSEQSPLFSMPTGGGTETTSVQSLSATGKMVPLTPHTIDENSILNQVIQRFQMRSNLRNSSISLKLHPVELGELRIDIAVKEGSLKANFMAQSQQVQEVLEKQMPRLRELMAQHGLNVDDILVSLDSDGIGQHGFSQENFNNDTLGNGSKKSDKTRHSFDQSLEQLLTEENDVDTGINVKA